MKNVIEAMRKVLFIIVTIVFLLPLAILFGIVGGLVGLLIPKGKYNDNFKKWKVSLILWCAKKCEGTTNIKGLKCDNPNCDYVDPDIEFKDYVVGMKCPKCGESLLTQEDYDTCVKILKIKNVEGK